MPLYIDDSNPNTIRLLRSPCIVQGYLPVDGGTARNIIAACKRDGGYASKITDGVEISVSTYSVLGWYILQAWNPSMVDAMLEVAWQEAHEKNESMSLEYELLYRG